MKKYAILSTILVVFFSLVFYGFQCSSTELTSARLYIQQKNFEKAEKSLSDEVKKNPQSEEGFFLLGYLNYEKKNYVEMLNNFEKASKIDKKHENEIKNYTKSAWAESFNEGVKQFSNATKKTDKEEMKLTMQKAIDAFNACVKLAPDSADNYKNLAYCYLNIQDQNKATEPLEIYTNKTKALDGYQMLSEIYLGKADKQFSAYMTSKNIQDSIESMKIYNKAIDLLEEATKKHQNNIELNTALFNSYLIAGKKDYAMKKAKDALENNPNDKANNYNLGTLLLETKNYTDAEKYLKKAVELDEKNENAVYNLVAVYINWGVKVREEETDKPEDKRSFKKYFEKAVPYLEKMTELRPNDFKLWTKLAQVYANLDMKDKAKVAFEKADKLSKESK